MELGRLTSLPVEIEAMSREADVEGHPFVRRLLDEWNAGVNRFDRPGEVLFGAWGNGRFVAVGGRNKDPYVADGSVGRVRHLYVQTAWRQQGIGRRLLDEIVAAARVSFRELHLRTRTE